MSRPRYETQADLDAERQLIDRLIEEKAPGAQAFKQPDYAGSAFLLAADGRARTVVEVKKRTCRHDAYQTIILSANKYDRLVYWTDMGYRALLLVGWADRTGFVELPVGHVEALGGRRDRGDHFDTEKVVHIKIAEFSFLRN